MLSLGIILGFGSFGTFAYWTDQASLTGTTFSAGTLDVTLDGSLGGQGGTYNKASLTLPLMVPGESVAVPLAVKNDGTVGFTYKGTVTSTNNTLNPSLRITVAKDKSASNSGSAANNNRVGACSGAGGNFVTNQVISTTASTVVAPDQTLAVGVTQTLCVLVALDSAAPNSMQGKATDLTFAFTATQLMP